MTVAKLLKDAGEACRKHHNRTVRELPGRRHFQCDELWSFVYAKEKQAASADPWDVAGTVWTWTALDSDSRMIVAYHATQSRGVRSATKILRDLKSRSKQMPDIAADGLESYAVAAKRVFGPRYSLTQGKGDGTNSNFERSNLTVRMGNRRYTRKTNGFSKTLARHKALLHLQFTHYNFCRIHTTLRVTPAMEAGIDDTLRDLEWIVDLIDANTPKPKKPGPKLGSKNRKKA
ncbi:MAG: hypothetical protein OXH76_08350 [Boseongicola sp.]|nr:hypothetical protein [Boseongicola sp.]